MIDIFDEKTVNETLKEVLSDDEWVVMPKEDYEAICDVLREKAEIDTLIVSGDLEEIISSLAGNVTVVTATAADVLEGAKFVNPSGETVTGTMKNNGSESGEITTLDGYEIPEGYHNGNGSVAISSAEQAKIIAGNILENIEILGITGTLAWQGLYRATFARSSGEFAKVATPKKASYGIVVPINIATRPTYIGYCSADGNNARIYYSSSSSTSMSSQTGSMTYADGYTSCTNIRDEALSSSSNGNVVIYIV